MLFSHYSLVYLRVLFSYGIFLLFIETSYESDRTIIIARYLTGVLMIMYYFGIEWVIRIFVGPFLVWNDALTNIVQLFTSNLGSNEENYVC